MLPLRVRYEFAKGEAFALSLLMELR